MFTGHYRCLVLNDGRDPSPDTLHVGNQWKQKIQMAALHQSPFLRHLPEQLLLRGGVCIYDSKERKEAASLRRSLIESYFQCNPYKNPPHLCLKRGSVVPECPEPPGKAATSPDCLVSEAFDLQLVKTMRAIGVTNLSLTGNESTRTKPRVILNPMPNYVSNSIVQCTSSMYNTVRLDPPLPITLPRQDGVQEVDASSDKKSTPTPFSITGMITKRYGVPLLSVSKKPKEDLHSRVASSIPVGTVQGGVEETLTTNQKIENIPIPAIESILGCNWHSDENSCDKYELCRQCSIIGTTLSVTERQFRRIVLPVSDLELPRSIKIVRDTLVLENNLSFHQVLSRPLTPFLLEHLRKKQKNKPFHILELNESELQERHVVTSASVSRMRSVGQMLTPHCFTAALFLPHVSNTKEAHSEHTWKVPDSDTKGNQSWLSLPFVCDVRRLVTSRMNDCEVRNLEVLSGYYPLSPWCQRAPNVSFPNEITRHQSSDDNVRNTSAAFCRLACKKSFQRAARTALLTGCCMKRSGGINCAYRGFMSGEEVDPAIYEQRYLRMIRLQSSLATGAAILLCEKRLCGVIQPTPRRFPPSCQFLLGIKKHPVVDKNTRKVCIRLRETDRALNESVDSFGGPFSFETMKSCSNSQVIEVGVGFSYLIDSMEEAGRLAVSVRREFLHLHEKAVQLSQIEPPRTEEGPYDDDNDNCSWIHNPTVHTASNDRNHEQLEVGDIHNPMVHTASNDRNQEQLEVGDIPKDKKSGYSIPGLNDEYILSFDSNATHRSETQKSKRRKIMENTLDNVWQPKKGGEDERKVEREKKKEKKDKKREKREKKREQKRKRKQSCNGKKRSKPASLKHWEASDVAIDEQCVDSSLGRHEKEIRSVIAKPLIQPGVTPVVTQHVALPSNVSPSMLGCTSSGSDLVSIPIEKNSMVVPAKAGRPTPVVIKQGVVNKINSAFHKTCLRASQRNRCSSSYSNEHQYSKVIAVPTHAVRPTPVVMKTLCPSGESNWDLSFNGEQQNARIIVAPASAARPTAVVVRTTQQNGIENGSERLIREYSRPRSLVVSKYVVDSTEHAVDITENRHERLAQMPTQGLGEYNERNSHGMELSDLPPVKLLCSEAFLESHGQAVAELASGRWAASFAVHVAEESATDNTMQMPQEVTIGRKLTLFDSPLVDDTGVSIELQDRNSLIACPLSSFSVMSFTKRVIQLSAMGRYDKIWILLISDVAITPALSADICILQNAIVPLEDGPQSFVVHNIVSPRSLSATIAHIVLNSQSMSPENARMEQIEGYLSDIRVEQRARFLLSIAPMLSVSRAFQLLVPEYSARKPDMFHDASKNIFQNLLSNNVGVCNQMLCSTAQREAHQISCALVAQFSNCE